MGQVIEKTLDNFTEGITDDPRRALEGLAQCVTGFDIFANTKRISPYPDTESGDSAAATSQKQAFGLGYWTPSSGSWRLFGLGVVSGSGKAEINMKTLSVGGTQDLSDDSWLTPANNASASGATSFNLFLYYKTLGKFLGAKGGSTIWSFTPDGATAFGDSYHSLSYTNIAQGIVHSKDDIAYIPYDNKIASCNNGSWTDVAISVPSHLYITSICEHESYVAIAAAPLSGVGKSVHYLWDRDSSLTTLSESLDGGEGITKVIESLEGSLVSISLDGGNSTRIRSRVVFRKYSGDGFKKFAEFVVPSGATALINQTKQKADGRVYFLMCLSIDGVIREGLWSVGISSSGRFAIAHEQTPNNGTALGNGVLKGFFVVGDFKFISYVDNSTTYQLSKTNDQVPYTAIAAWESPILNLGDSDIIKKLIGASLTFEPLPANGRVALYYKKDAESVWLRLFAYDTDNGISHGSVNLESDSNAFTVTIASPGVFTLANHGLAIGQKIRLSTTGALPTGLTAGTEYYVISAGYTSSTFRLATTSGGAAINTSGVQSGVHTITRNDNLGEGKEFRFRLESTGGTVITGLRYKMEIVDKQLY